jgi:hypothetical protein
MPPVASGAIYKPSTADVCEYERGMSDSVEVLSMRGKSDTSVSTKIRPLVARLQRGTAMSLNEQRLQVAPYRQTEEDPPIGICPPPFVLAALARCTSVC